MTLGPLLNPLCSICFQPVDLETAKTDSAGQPVHEDCYVRKIADNADTEMQ